MLITLFCFAAMSNISVDIDEPRAYQFSSFTVFNFFKSNKTQVHEKKLKWKQHVENQAEKQNFNFLQFCLAVKWIFFEQSCLVSFFFSSDQEFEESFG